MADRFLLSRRQLLKTSTAGVAAGLVASVLPVPVLPVRRAFAAGLTVGFIYVGPKDDYGYNQAHAEGAKVVKALDGVTVVEEENVPETVDVSKTMESMINLDGATLLFPTSFGYFDPFMLDEAKKHADIQFRHCGGLWTEKNPPNTGSYFGYIGMCQYLNGIVAGSLGMHWWTFLLFNAIGAALWVSAWTLGSYYLGAHAAELLHRFGLAGGILAAAALVVAVAVVWLIKRRRG